YNNYFQISNSFTSVAPVTIWQVIGKTCDTALEIEGLESFSFDLTQSTTYPYFSETLIADASDYDGTVNSISETTGFGHTFKPYFFYETPDGIAEYGGKELPLSELEKAEGYDKVKSIIDEEGYSINNIYFRENGIININLYKKESSDAEYTEYSCSYINLAYVNGRLEMLSDIDGNYFGEGIYLSSKSTGLATFPSQDSIIE
ncbi:MAG: hypothetical protein SPJ42_02275, partial [Oscillospiraceae bacterium]|nr:hypothetical protein [Oscillospiraceae bacterium]